MPCTRGAQIAQKYNLVIVEDDAYWWLQYGNEEAEPDEMAHSNGRAKASIGGGENARLQLGACWGHAGGEACEGGCLPKGGMHSSGNATASQAGGRKGCSTSPTRLAYWRSS